ncbi:MAG: ATP-binding cassette domain-containing protein [Alphaproteobacteria bacterium GM7ARS4]|nr:ATP-binding cassette domain-containing protein [Alphaproteobacteria bacterium GM7ARS4]
MPAHSPAHALCLEDVSYRYPTSSSASRPYALSNLSFTLKTGHFHVLLGLNGAGKTTLFSLITHLYAVQTGRISVFGHDIAKHYRHALRSLGVVFQHITLDLDLTTQQNLLYHASLHGMSKKDATQRSLDLLEQANLIEYRKTKTRFLSGGQRRRVEIIRALLHKPQFLLLDEPTVGLDINSRDHILAHVRSLCTKEQLSVLWATHLIQEIDDQSLILILDKGVLKAHSSPHDIMKTTKTSSIKDAFRHIIDTPHTHTPKHT